MIITDADGRALPADSSADPAWNVRFAREDGPELAHMFGFRSAIAPRNPNIYDFLATPANIECDLAGGDDRKHEKAAFGHDHLMDQHDQRD
jgi:hypothetical protein